MTGLAWIVGMSAIAQGAPADANATAADTLTFRDGTILLGQVLDGDRRGPLPVLARRDWVARNLPDRAAAWTKAEAPGVRRAIAQRRDRLACWRADRLANPSEGDRILAWIDREMARLAGPTPEVSPLMLVRLNRTEVKAVARRARGSNRMLRLGWLSGLPEVESIPTADLSRALEGRGIAPGLADGVDVESLLPLALESDGQWVARRASTELAHDPGGRFLRHQGLLLPEPAPGEPLPDASGLEAAVSGLKTLMVEAPVDPLPGKLADLARKGRVGAIVTRLDLAPDFSSVAVETALWVRSGPDRWAPALARSANARPGGLPVDGLADDPQVRAAFGVVEALGFGAIPAEVRQQSLDLGAATRKALGQARGALDREIQPLAFSLESPP